MNPPTARFWRVLGAALVGVGGIQLVINLLQGHSFRAGFGALQVVVGILMWLFRDRLARHRR